MWGDSIFESLTFPKCFLVFPLVGDTCQGMWHLTVPKYFWECLGAEGVAGCGLWVAALSDLCHLNCWFPDLIVALESLGQVGKQICGLYS